MKPFYTYYLCALLMSSMILFSCKGKDNTDANNADSAVDARTPVTVTTISKEAMADYIELNASSVFLQKSYVKAISNGYLQSLDTKIGKYVTAGQPLFTMKTKEAQSIGNTINSLDSSFKFSGVSTIRANSNGYITQLNHQNGDYVQDGEQVAVISDMNSFVFLMQLPYELRPYVLNKNTVELLLPDGVKLSGTIASAMPTMDSAAQTQNIVIRVHPDHSLPENLIAKVRIVKTSKTNAVSLPKSAVLTNETQSEYWVMKLEDSATAVKIPIEKGLETNDRVEILSPVFSDSDKILITGNYGLQDTAKVKVEGETPAIVQSH